MSIVRQRNRAARQHIEGDVLPGCLCGEGAAQ